MIVTVLGGGNGAYATAADLALGGHRVRLARRAENELGAVREAGGITLVAEERQGLARLDRVTTKLDEALAGAELVVIAVPATAHADLARDLASRLTPEQIVLLTPGTLGAFAMARDISRAGGNLPLAFAETGTLPYLARKTGPAAVSAPVRAANLPVGVFPASRSGVVLPKIAELYPAARPCADALDVALTNVGSVIHPPLVLLNAGAIDAGRFDIHATGTTPSARRVIDALDTERVQARRGWGYAAPHYEMATYYDEARASEGLYGAGAKARLIASGLWNEIVTFEHRYVTEDVAVGLALIESAARTVGVVTPAASGLLQVFGVLLARQLSGGGRALENLGLGDFSVREIRALLHEGWESSVWPKVLR
ncbi:MAG: NAD/NADP octopine/nopaline dehydrogenase family protein [Candidatus Rokubacteria bacterium]|nr:NAD/NADP octopine/nopaline dehydrogenase family protein [Candidatus Rokubacteria bacterium]